MRRLVALGVVGALLLVGTASTAAPLSGTFTDEDGNPHEPNIQAIAAAGITLGCGPARYCPAGTVRRDEMASFLARSLALPPLGSGPFSDVGGNIHAGSINAIAAVGITLGCGGGRYCPAGTVRRDEMASFLTRAFDLTPTASPFVDTAGNVHADAIGAIASAEITLGCGSGTFCPAAPVHRDEMASFLARALGLEPVHVLLRLTTGIPYQCTKDELVCTASITVPTRDAYDVSEGFYNVQPYAAGEEALLSSPATRFELTVDGVGQPLTSRTVEGPAVERRFDGRVTLPPGSHTLVGRWYWDGSLTATRTLRITVTP